MSTLRLDGRVAIVTGGGRGLGRAHARLLAARGCAVVVNDLGGDGEGQGSAPNVAQAVVQEIMEAGGRAVADCSDVGDPFKAEALVHTAIGAFGRIDAIINNAGLVFPRPFEEISLADCERIWRINFGGSFNVTQAAWPHFKNQQYGFVCNVDRGHELWVRLAILNRAVEYPSSSARAVDGGYGNYRSICCVASVAPEMLDAPRCYRACAS